MRPSFRSSRKQIDQTRRSLMSAGLGGLLLASPGPTAFARPVSQADASTRFVVCYGAIENPADLLDYDVLVLDAEVDEAALRGCAPGATRLGYLSLCEVNMTRAYAPDVASQGLLLFENKNWSDARYVDLRDPRWTRRVTEQLIPALIERGFNGLFVDTLDDAEYLEALDAKRFNGMRDAAVTLMRTIRRRHPNLAIMVNRGYALLARIIDDVDMVMGESVRSTFDARQGGYVLVGNEGYLWQRDRLQAAKALRPEIGLFTLDYWAADDPRGRARLYAQQRANGFAPYVATFDLRRIVSES